MFSICYNLLDSGKNSLFLLKNLWFGPNILIYPKLPDILVKSLNYMKNSIVVYGVFLQETEFFS